MIKKYLFTLLGILFFMISVAQTPLILKGRLQNSNGAPIKYASIKILNSHYLTQSDSTGNFAFFDISAGEYTLSIKALGYPPVTQNVVVNSNSQLVVIKIGEVTHSLEEVIVSAEKRDEIAQNIPSSIAVLSANKISEYKLWDIKELTAIVPNLYQANPGDNRNVTSIRGISSTSYTPAVATYIDGVNQFGLDTYISQLQDVERIEVLSGPQGTLYGRSAMGGVINIITKTPDNNTKALVELGYGNFDQQRVNIALKLPIVKNKVFFGASGLYNSRTGFYRNIYNNTSFDPQYAIMGNYAVKFLANPKTVVTLNVKHVNNRNKGAFPLAGNIDAAFGNPFRLEQNAVGKMVDNTLNSSLTVDRRGQNFNFTSQTAYQSNYRFYLGAIDGDFSSLDGYAIVNNYGRNWNKVNVWSQDFRLTSPSNIASKFTWVAGSYLFYQNSPTKQGTHIGADGALLGADAINFTSINTNISQNYGIAFYGQTNYTITPKLSVVLGMRYDLERTKQSILGEYQPDGGQVVVIRPDTSSASNFHAFSPKAGLQYSIDPKSTVYANYSKGFRSGGISPLSGNPEEALILYQPELSSNFEFGSKNVFFDSRLKLNAVAFYNSVNNAQVPTLLLPDAITVISNAGRLISKGLELQTEYNVATNLNVTYNLGYTNAKYRSLDLPNNGATVNFMDNNQVFTPKYTSFLATNFSHYLNRDRAQIFANAQWRVIGKQFFDLANQFSQDGFSLTNVNFGVKIKKSEITFWGDNIFDKKYIDYAFDFGAAHLGSPRTFGITVKTIL